MIRVEDYQWGHYDYLEEWHSSQAHSCECIDVKCNVKNHGKKAVKKYTVYFTAYNGADEILKNQITGKSIIGISSADRLEPYCTQKLEEELWVNKSIRRVKIDHIDVVYADDTTESCKGNYVLTKEEQAILAEREKKEKKEALIVYIIVFFINFIFS